MNQHEIKDQIEILADEIFSLFNQMNKLIVESTSRYYQFRGIVLEILETSQFGDPVSGPITELAQEMGIKLPSSRAYLIMVNYNTLQLHIYEDVYPIGDETAKYIVNVVSLSDSEGASWLWGGRVIDTKTLAFQLLNTITGRAIQLSSGLVA